ncbi:MAG: dipicolinate synthase subunit DpsA [bacterium]|nr:dipicolinate synthase [bacterium]MDD6225290.1 dipicolinate synthase subunit DpsA [bacterium]MDY3861826.1 dipicolinate synthase subunit DpsA [Ruminococcus sp.]
MTETVGIIGGDKRYLFAARSFLDDGYKVKLFGFDKLLSFGRLEVCCDLEELGGCQTVIFPIPPVKESGILNAPFSQKPIKPDMELAELIKGKKVFCPMKSKLIKACPDFESDESMDYFAREDFTLLNAYLTAEGAVQTMLNSFEGAILNSRVLVCGFGRIGKCLAKMLRDLRAQVYVSARKPEDFAKIAMNGYYPMNTEKLREIRGFDVVFNTAPAMIFNERLLKNTDADTLLIDLASLPGGIDKTAAESLDIDVIHALSLPGKTAPKTAGEIIKNTIVKMLKEDTR